MYPPVPRRPKVEGFEPTDIREGEYLAETARRRLEELQFPPHLVAPPVRNRVALLRLWRGVRFLLVFYGSVAILAMVVAHCLIPWIVKP